MRCRHLHASRASQQGGCRRSNGCGATSGPCRPPPRGRCFQDFDAVVNCAGALQDGARDDVTAVQQTAMLALYEAAAAARIGLIVQISARVEGGRLATGLPGQQAPRRRSAGEIGRFPSSFCARQWSSAATPMAAPPCCAALQPFPGERRSSTAIRRCSSWRLAMSRQAIRRCDRRTHCTRQRSGARLA